MGFSGQSIFKYPVTVTQPYMKKWLPVQHDQREYTHPQTRITMNTNVTLTLYRQTTCHNTLSPGKGRVVTGLLDYILFIYHVSFKNEMARYLCPHNTFIHDVIKYAL